MPQLSLRDTAAICGVRPRLSVLRDVMVYGAYQSKSLRNVLTQMSTDCTLDPDALGHLVGLAGSASITSVEPDVSGLRHNITLSLALTNLTNGTVDVHDAQLFLTDSGGGIVTVFAMFGQGTIFENANVPLPAGSMQTGNLNLRFGASTFNFVASIHATGPNGSRHHLLRRFPIQRAGFPDPENLATPSPVFVTLWDRPAEVIPVFHNGAATQWLTVGGQIVNRARQGVSITIDALRFRLFSESKPLPDADVQPSNWFFRPSDGRIVVPNPDGRVPLKEPYANFVFGFPVQVTGARPTLRVDLLYTATEGGSNTQGKATTALQVVVVKPTVLHAPLISPPNGIWNWGNAPDHTTFTDPNGSPTGFDSHANFGEHYCFDITMVMAPGGPTFAGTCNNLAGGLHSGDCTNNASFFAWGMPVMAAKAGKIARNSDGPLVQSSLPENFGFDANPATGIGDFVVIDHGDGTFAGYFHLKKGSLLVSDSPGKDSVVAGQQIGSLGNSGSSSEPHLHFGYAVTHPTGRGVIGSAAFAGLRALDNTPVTVIPGNGLYQS